MTYEEALKKVQSTKVKDNYVVIELSYDSKMVLPHKDAMAVLSALASAEILKDYYGEKKRIIPVERNKFVVTFMSATEYEQHKIAAMLGISFEEVQEMQKPKPQTKEVS